MQEIDALVHALHHTLFEDYYKRQPDLLPRLQQAMARCAPGADPTCAETFLKQLQPLREMLMRDAQAALDGDPAASGVDEVIIAYPGFFALAVHRLAHAFKKHDVPLLPRMMTEAAHSRTGIDLHPGAVIGEYAFIDHGTGVVVGETTHIGTNVRIYQGVTLGALSLPRQATHAKPPPKRHPTIGNHVTIYANATILGGETVVGDSSIIGGSVFLTHSVPPNSRVSLANQQLRVQGGNQPPRELDIDFQI
jgi:serine O-acetyltransferase